MALRPLLEPGRTYDVAIRNLSRLVRCGYPLATATRMVLEQAGLTSFPRPPAPTVHWGLRDREGQLSDG